MKNCHGNLGVSQKRKKINERNQKTAGKGAEGQRKAKDGGRTNTIPSAGKRKSPTGRLSLDSNAPGLLRPRHHAQASHEPVTLLFDLLPHPLSSSAAAQPSSGAVKTVPVHGGSRALRSAPGRKLLCLAAGSGSVSGGGKLGEG